MKTKLSGNIKAMLEAVKKHSEMEEDAIQEAGEHGADCGWPGFTYTSDCVEFYDKHEDAIMDMVLEDAKEFGYKDVASFVASFARTDMLDTGAEGFKNLLAWYVLETVGRALAD